MAEETLSKQAVRAAYGWGRERSWADALALIEQAARAGEPEAQQQFELVSQMDLEALLSPPPVRPLSTVSLIAECRGFAPPGFSEWLIDTRRTGLWPLP